MISKVFTKCNETLQLSNCENLSVKHIQQSESVIKHRFLNSPLSNSSLCSSEASHTKQDFLAKSFFFNTKTSKQQRGQERTTFRCLLDAIFKFTMFADKFLCPFFIDDRVIFLKADLGFYLQSTPCFVCLVLARSFTASIQLVLW